jgi:hypothetical protein
MKTTQTTKDKMAFDYPFGIFKLLTIVLSVLLQVMASDYPFGIFKLLIIVLSVLVRLTSFVSSNYFCTRP